MLGYLGVTSGRFSDLGVSSRNGAEIAVAQFNRDGGVHGRRVELASFDSALDTETALAAMRELAATEAIAVVGPSTSDVALAVLPVANENEIALVSPTASTTALTGIDDFFLRVNPPDYAEAREMARYCFEINDLDRVVVAYDLVNASFSERLADAFEEYAGEIAPAALVGRVDLDSSNPVDYAAIASRIAAADPQAVFLVAGAFDTAMVAQRLRLTSADPDLLLSGWAFTDEVIQQGGRAVEGAILNHYHDIRSSQPRYVAFRDEYVDRFGSEPDAFATLGYNAVVVALIAARERERDESIRDAIARISEFEGAQGTLTMDRYGDCELERFFIQIVDGRFERITL